MSTPDPAFDAETDPARDADSRPADTRAADSRRHFETEGTDLDEAREFYTEGYNGSGFHMERTEKDFVYRYSLTGDDEMTLRSSAFFGTVLGTVQPKDEYIVSWISSGTAVMDLGGDETALALGRPAMFPTGKRFAFHFAETRQNLVQFDARYLERIAAERTGAAPGPLHFHHQVVPEAQELTAWKSTITRVARVVLGAPGDAPASPLLRAEANRAAAEALLATFSHDAPRPTMLLQLPSHAKLRAAVEFMHARAEQPITATDIAEAAGLSLRGLQHVFQQQLDTTPTDYLRGIRLDHVRAELGAHSPADTTVAAVARRWGFAHAGRFAGAYVRRFGEYPAATLGRA
ncbi:AraC family transcriptional regulator [Frondihabitans australicus]|uniref:AraC family transcriptional regulator n=1 Tax=Frondihabitans australicus TaxID=386892 RepID=A0A495IKQ5_9MICO|nr:helix-turn-helix domain-containing protein [Frondihabitans australicus]RKR76557.1 AraC family transcriptional regulator [Frondihabitans australicus]